MTLRGGRRVTTYTYSQARQHFATVLSNAEKDGKVIIKRRDGSLFILQPLQKISSPLDVKGVKAKVSAAQIVDAIRESRER